MFWALRCVRVGVVILVLGLCGAVIATPGGAATAGSVTFTPAPIPLSDPDVTDPLRGLYKWRGQQLAPVASFDSYDRFTWRNLEPTVGHYDFSAIDAALADAKSRGGEFGFRVRALVDQQGSSVPQYVMDHLPNLGYWYDFKDAGRGACDPLLGGGSCDTYVPDWNDPYLLDRVIKLLQALGQRYASDPRLAFVDVGVYGDFGEWQMYGFPAVGPTGAQPITAPNKHKIIDAVVNAFPSKFILMSTSDSNGLAYALAKSPRVGWRRDSLGNAAFDEAPTTWSSLVSNVTANLAETSIVYSGKAAASFTLTGPWGQLGFQAISGNALDASAYATLHFAARAGQATSNLIAVLRNGSTTLGTVSLANYGGQPIPGAWKVYDIPLAAFSALTSTITDVRLQDQTGQASGLTYYLDEVGFSRGPCTTPYLIYDDALTGAWTSLTKERWKTAPVVTEFWGSAAPGTDLSSALAQVATYHVSMVSNGNYRTTDWAALSPAEQATLLQIGKKAGYRLTLNAVTVPDRMAAGTQVTLTSRWANDGNAPVYQWWTVTWQLRSTNSPPRVLWHADSTLDLTHLLPTNGVSATVTDTLPVPGTMSPGVYQLAVIVQDPTGYRAPLALAIRGRQGDGTYVLGNVTVTL
jgi:hypothetical protein